jgi:hypothetical protein
MDTRLVNVKPNHRPVLAKLHRERQANITKADNSKLNIFQFLHIQGLRNQKIQIFC